MNPTAMQDLFARTAGIRFLSVTEPHRLICQMYVGIAEEMSISWVTTSRRSMMSNPSGLPDPTAEQAIYNASKATRYLPKELHKAFRVCKSILELFGYEFTEVRFKDRDGKKYLWGGRE